MAEGKPGDSLISFESGHYKKVTGFWKNDSVWSHFTKADGGMVHVNKEKVEYMETFGGGNIEPVMADLNREKMQAEINLLKAEAEKTLNMVGEPFKLWAEGWIKGFDERLFTIEKKLEAEEKKGRLNLG